jgi:predicted ribosome quality control (RQC) complex YloA/Tae2 family protein
VRGATGAHGILRTNNRPERVSENILRKAAAIVAAKSGASKHSSLVPVDITERRYVRKPKGAKPGLATYSQARTLDVTPELP